MTDPARIEPGPGQESVWDYPRPPRLERSDRHLRVTVDDVVVAETRRAWRVLETSQPPAYYFPPADVSWDHLTPTASRTFCEWKGLASYVSIEVVGRVIPDAGWLYPDPIPSFDAIRDHLAFYPQRVDRCTVDGEVVDPNEGSFYGGWITSDIVGPFKGGAGSAHW